jgi:hypothetical protein
MSGESRLLEQDDVTASPALVAPPWTMHGSCYIVLLRAGSLTDQQLCVPPSLVGKRHGQTLSLVFFDYAITACGPYRELILGVGFDFAEGQYSSITRAYASTLDSVANTRRNWGVPVDLADFSVERVSSKRDQVVLTREGRVIADLELEHFGLSIPVTTALLPSDLRTMVQHWHGKQYGLTLNAKGKMRMAKLRRSRFDAGSFPDVSQSSVIASAYLPSFELELPAATQRDI